MRKTLWILTVLFAYGCVTKGTYLSELTKRQDFEKQSQDLGTRLESEIARRQATEKTVADLTDRKSALEAALSAEKAAHGQESGRAAQLQSERDGVRAERDALRAELSAEKAARGREETRTAQLQAERDRLASSLTSEKGGRTEEVKKAALLQADRDGLAAALASEKAARAEEASRVSRLQGDLDAQAAARTRAEQDAQALGARVAALQGQLAALEQDKRRAEEEKQRKLEETTRQYEGLLAAMKGEVAKGEITISNLKGRLTVNMLDEILFDSGSAKIKPKGMEVLRRVGDALKDVADKAVVIEGHTDNVALKERLKEKYPTNWELSTARATSVVRYFQDDVGLDPLKLSAVGFGEYRPVDTNETTEGKQRNRRIEIKLVPLEAPLFGLPPQEGAAAPAAEPSKP